MVHRPPPAGAGDRPPAEVPPPHAAPAPAAGEALPGFSLPLTPTRMVLQVSGSQDFYPVHHDRDFARAGGHADIFVNTGFLRAALCRVVTDWLGEGGMLRRLAFQMRRPHLLGDTITAGGRIAARRREDGRELADLEVWIENQRGGVATPGRATVELPRRG
jgi:acyl dehydratase